MTNRSIFRAGLLAGTRMTANERRLGRFIRDGEGHPAPAAEPAPAAAPAAPSGDAWADLELEMGDVVLPGSEADEGDPAPKADEPGVSDAEPKDDQPDEVEVERRRADAAEERIRELEAKGKEPPKKDDAAPVPSEESDPAPNPTDYEFGEADSKFIADSARWNARQEFVQMRAKEQLTTELNTIEAGWKSAVEAEDFKAEYPDFDKVVTEGAAKEAWDCTPLMALAIKSSPVGGHVAYELASKPAEATRIAKLIPVEQAFELGKLEGRIAFERAAKKAAPAPTAKVASSAPPPPAQRSRGSGGQYASELSSVQDRMLKEF